MVLPCAAPLTELCKLAVRTESWTVFWQHYRKEQAPEGVEVWGRNSKKIPARHVFLRKHAEANWRIRAIRRTARFWSFADPPLSFQLIVHDIGQVKTLWLYIRRYGSQICGNTGLPTAALTSNGCRPSLQNPSERLAGILSPQRLPFRHPGNWQYKSSEQMRLLTRKFPLAVSLREHC